MAFLLKLFVFASLCIFSAFSVDPVKYECNENGLRTGLSSNTGATFVLDCQNPPIVYLTQDLEVTSAFSMWLMNGVILRSTADSQGNKFGLRFLTSNFSLSNGVVEVPVSIKNSTAVISSVNVRRFNATGGFSSSISSIDSQVAFVKSSTFATAGSQGSLYVSGGTFSCQQSSLIFNSVFNVTGASFSFENLNNSDSVVFDECTIKGNSLSLKGSNFNYVINTRASIWDVPTLSNDTFYGDYNVFQSSQKISGSGNVYGAMNIFEKPIESPTNYIGASSYDCPFATAWVPLAACSPALDIVPSSAFYKDQNGNNRLQGGGVDAGAIESYLRPCLNAEFSKKVTQCVNSVVLTLTLSSRSASTVSVFYNTVGATAVAGVDYVAESGFATFSELSTQVEISIKLIQVQQYGGAQKIFRVMYSNASNADLKSSSSVIKLECASPFTTSALTTSPMTTAAVTSGAITSAAMTTAAMTTAVMTTNQMTTVTPVTSSAMTTAAVTTGDVTSAALTTATTTSSITSDKGLTTRWMTTAPLTQSSTTAAPRLTTGYMSGQANSTTECDALSIICKMDKSYCTLNTTFTVDGSVYSYNDFNAISFGDFYLEKGKIEGRLLVGGSFYAAEEGISIGDQLSNNSFPYSLIVGGNAIWVEGEAYPRGVGVFVGSNFTGADYLQSRVAGYCPKAGCLSDEVNKMKNFFVNASKALASVSDTATFSLSYQALNITCNNGAKIQTLTIDASVFSKVTEYVLYSCDPSSMFLFNIKGASAVVFQGRALPTPAVVYNILESTRVYVNATVLGSILAPLSVYTQTGGYVEGQVVTASNAATVQISMPGCANASVIISSPGDQIQSSNDASTTVFSFVLAVIMSLVILL